MKKMTGQFTRYTVVLLIVGAILVLIGGLSVGRKAIANQREIALDMSAKTRVNLISNENVQLKSENAQLKAENDRLKVDTAEAIIEKDNALKKVQTLEAFMLMQEYVDKKDIENAKRKLELIDETLLPDEFKEKYEKIAEKIKTP